MTELETKIRSILAGYGQEINAVALDMLVFGVEREISKCCKERMVILLDEIIVSMKYRYKHVSLEDHIEALEKTMSAIMDNLATQKQIDGGE